MAPKGGLTLSGGMGEGGSRLEQVMLGMRKTKSEKKVNNLRGNMLRKAS